MIKVEHVVKKFKHRKVEKIALNDVNLTLPNKGMIFIIGKSGSGKSTLLNLMAAFDKPTSGNIFFDDIDIVNMKEKKRDKYLTTHVGFIFQAYNLFENLTVKENIALGLKTSYKKIENKISLILDEVYLHGYENKKVKQLSGGEKQRVAIARALIKKPEIIFADEPCGNLDNVNSQIVSNILKQRSKQSLVVVVSHNLNDAYKYGDRVITLNQGQILSDRAFDKNSIDKAKEYALIDDLTLLHRSDCDEIISNIKEKKIKGFYPRKEFFTEVDENNIPLEKTYKPKKERFGFIRSFFTNIKLIFTKKYKNLAFAVISGLSLSIFTVCLALTDFSPNNYFVRNVDKIHLSTYKYFKGNKVGQEVFYTDLVNITDEDKAFIKDNYKEKVYPRYRHIFSVNGEENPMTKGVTPTYNLLRNFYVSSSTGLVICDEDYLKKALEVDDIIYTAKIDTPIKNGLYITDFFADSIIYNSKKIKTHQDVINDYQKVGTYINRYTDNPINGIIKTNYLDRCKELKEKISIGFSIDELSKEEKYVEQFNYILDSLLTCYTFNENFFEDDSWTYRIKLTECYLVNPVTGVDSFSGSNYFASYSSLLPENTIMIPQKLLKSIDGVTEKRAMEVLLNKVGYNFETRRTTSSKTPFDVFTYKPNYVITENHPEFIDPSHKVTNNSYITLSKDLYKVIKNRFHINFAMHFLNKDVLSIDKELNDRNLLCDNYLTKYSSKIGNYIIRFKDIFRIFYAFCGALNLFILIYFATSTIKDNRYNIGVLKSLGYRSRELSLFYFSSFIFYSLGTTLLFSISYFGLSKLVNEVMVTLVRRGYHLDPIVGMPDVIAFDVPIFLGVSILLFIMNILFSFIYLFKLRQNRISNIIQNKE